MKLHFSLGIIFKKLIIFSLAFPFFFSISTLENEKLFRNLHAYILGKSSEKNRIHSRTKPAKEKQLFLFKSKLCNCEHYTTSLCLYKILSCSFLAKLNTLLFFTEKMFLLFPTAVERAAKTMFCRLLREQASRNINFF